MKVHVIGTVNGQFDEGMRNVATHLSNVFEQKHRVFYSGLKSIPSIIRNSRTCDVTMIFARANKQVYWLARMVGLLSKRVWIVCVQKPDQDFTRLTSRSPLNANYLAIAERDLEQIELKTKYKKVHFNLGIKSLKFHPVDTQTQKALKEKYGIARDKLLVVHVGHCSEGRGLADFTYLTDTEKLVVASGMFEHADTVKVLEENGVRIIRGYIENIEEVYQMADVYLFPTRCAEYVISIPLSVMEALSCGLPVIGYKELVGLSEIPSCEGAITLIEDSSQLNDAVIKVAQRKCATSLLQVSRTWEQSAEEILEAIKEAEI